MIYEQDSSKLAPINRTYISLRWHIQIPVYEQDNSKLIS